LEQVDLHPDDLGRPKVVLKIGLEGHGKVTHVKVVQKLL
jgi:hypothetical protein